MTKIKNSDRIWLEDRKEVTTGFNEYFQNLFSSDGQRDWHGVLDCLEAKVTDDMNSDLLHLISLEEVKAAVFDLGALKAPGPDGVPRNLLSSILGNC